MRGIVEDGRIYINDRLYNIVASREEINIEFSSSITSGFTQEGEVEKLKMLERIKESKCLYFLEMEEGNEKSSVTIAVYYVDGIYFLLNARLNNETGIYNISFINTINIIGAL